MIRTEAPAGEATQVLGTSLRAVPVETTLALAEAWAPRLGITRVTDITRLDRIGIPVFASIRPGAHRGSLCVNAGKGLTPEEARAGATMEAIEFALAEHGASAVEVVAATARDVIDGRERSDAVLDFCPVMGARIPLDEPLACVEAEELVSGGTCLVPAELVFLPAPRSLIPRQYFGPSSNALSSGNTVEEATVHALTEIIERDVLSFHSFRDETRLVREETLPARARELADAIRRAGLRLYVRYCPNAYAVPWFSAILVDPEETSPSSSTAATAATRTAPSPPRGRSRRRCRAASRSSTAAATTSCAATSATNGSRTPSAGPRSVSASNRPPAPTASSRSMRSPTTPRARPTCPPRWGS